MVDLRPLEPARVSVINVLQAGGDFELGRVEAPGEGAVFLPGPLPFDQQAQPSFKIQLGDLGLAALFFQGLGHAVQAQRREFFERLSVEHKFRDR